MGAVASASSDPGGRDMSKAGKEQQKMPERGVGEMKINGDDKVE